MLVIEIVLDDRLPVVRLHHAFAEMLIAHYEGI